MNETVSAARCGHFGTCGGCAVQDLPYDQQVERKHAYLLGLLAPYLPSPFTVHRSPSPWYYRNKMEFSFGRLGHRVPPEGKPYEYVLDGTVLGLKQKGKWDKTLDLQDCYLLSPETPALLASVRAWYGREGLEGFDAKSARGFLRHLLVREGKGTGQRMVMALTASGNPAVSGVEPFPAESFVKAVREAYPATTVLHAVNDDPSDVAKSADVRVLYGPGTIEEKIEVRKPLRFRISPFSFFQTNTQGTEVLYKLVRDFVRPSGPNQNLKPNLEGLGLGLGSGPQVLYDLYGGAGGIAFSLHDLFEKVISVENVLSASEDGRHNAALNGITNVEFVTAAVEKYLLEEVRCQMSEDRTVVLDPPRAGLHPKVLRALNLIRPKTLVYVSCNPKLLALDLKALAEVYKVVRFEAVDLFPHTEHVEAVARLELL